MYTVTQTLSGFRVTTPYKAIDKLHPYGHRGIDLAMPLNSPIHAVSGGKVIVSGYDDKLGNWIKIEGNDGTDIIYGHLNSSSVHVGDYVIRGQEIALSGSTGRSTGPHLHLQTSQDGNLTDPTEYASRLIGGHENDHTGFMDNIHNVSNFIKDTHDEGIWFAFTGQHFKDSLIQFLLDFTNMLIQLSDLLIIAAMILGLGTLAGSGFCKKWLYYTSILFVILKCVGGLV